MELGGGEGRMIKLWQRRFEVSREGGKKGGWEVTGQGGGKEGRKGGG